MISCNFVIQSTFSPPATKFCDSLDSPFIHILNFLNEIGTLQERMKISVELTTVQRNGLPIVVLHINKLNS